MPRTSTPLISLAGVSRVYPGPPPLAALHPIDLIVLPGQYLGIMGPSGSGKSTLLNLIGLLDRPSEGRVEIAGQDMSAASERARTAIRAHQIGFVFQSFHLLPYRTATENVELAQIYSGTPRRSRRGLAREALSRVGLAHRADALPTELSGGERQRVAVARALVNRPALLLCDEPTGNLDSVTTGHLLDLFDELHDDGVTLLVITHNAQVADRARRQVTIRDGRLSERQPGWDV
jgi:putative ABC transport system ATP-binding protein